MIRFNSLLFVLVLLSANLVGSAANTQSVDWRKQIGTFRVGMVGSNTAGDAAKRLRPLKQLLQRELGMPVEFFLARDFTTLIQNQVNSRIEYAIYSSTAFATAWMFCRCVEPLVSPLAEDGSRGFSSVLIARRADGLTLTTLRNKTVSLGSKGSFATHQFPSSVLRSEGVDISSIGWKLMVSPTPDEEIGRFANKEADALFGWEPVQGTPEKTATSGTIVRLEKFREDQVGELSVLWRSPLVPYGVHSVRTSLPEEAKTLLLGLMLTLKERNEKIYGLLEPERRGGFTQAVVEDFAAVIEFIQHIDADPADK